MLKQNQPDNILNIHDSKKTNKHVKQADKQTNKYWSDMFTNIYHHI